MPQTNPGTVVTGSEMAIIGMAARFPGAADVHQFWDNLKQGKESVSFLSDREIEESGIRDERVQHPNFVNAKGGVLENAAYFDAPFFGYSPREAELMDPQMRLFHECAWEALEDAGCCPETYFGLIGLYAGASSNVYWRVKSMLSRKDDAYGDIEASLLMNRDFLCTRISYNLDLKGPSFTVQSACSTSLLAIHLACQAILNGECHMALAGGVSIASGANNGYIHQEGMIFSPDGRCRAFDAKAKGTIYGEGIGIVVLKSLEDAREQGDHIYAVIKGTAVNNDGKQKVGYTAPGIEGQVEVIRVAQQVAEVEPESIGYVEAHGTGTELGDPAEIQALKLAFNTGKRRFCGIGSLKTNIGHLDAAAGVAGLIKAVLSLKHKQVPPSLHFETPNPKIDFENSPFYVVDKLVKWESKEYPLRAGVSSFGMGGTNAHAVLEEAPGQSPHPDGREYKLILLSARTESALDRAAGNLVQYLKENPDVNLADTAYTLQTGRKVFPFRRMSVCRDVNEAIDRLSPGDTHGRKTRTHFCSEEKRQVVFMFSGLGAQYVDMGLGLYRTEPVFRRHMDRCFEVLKGIAGYDIKEVLYPSLSSQKGAADGVDRFEIAQLVIFVLEYALAKLLMEWGITPQAMIGYSFGEYTAACISGVFSLEETLRLIVDRGKLVNETGTGAMLSVPAPGDTVMPLLDDELSIAIDNGPSCIVSGTAEAVEAFERKMKEKRYVCVPLKGTHAIHSGRMALILERFKKRMEATPLSEPQIPYISNVTGDWITVEDAVDPGYWAAHLRKTVQFAKGIEELVKQQGEDCVFIEIGPGHDLTVLLKHYVKNDSRQWVLNTVRYQKEKVTDEGYLVNQIGKLWLAGVEIDWNQFYAREKRCKVPLPTYPFERERYWIEGDPYQLMEERAFKEPRLKKEKEISKWFYTPSWQQSDLAAADPAQALQQWKWLVFVDENEQCAGVVEYLKQHNSGMITVKMGAGYEAAADHSFVIDPREPADYDKLFDELHRRNQVPEKILHFWGLSFGTQKELSLERWERFQDTGLFSLLGIARALGKQAHSHTIHINVITNNSQEVIGGELLYPEKAAVIGAVKVIPLEYFNIRCRAVDILEQDLETAANSDFVHRLLLEFVSDAPGPVVAYRGNYRWGQDFRPVHLDKNNTEGIRRLRKKGVYLITGGFGGMGFGIARFLASQYKAKLILVSRSGSLPEEDIKTRTLREMQQKGGQVLIFKADAADYEQMKHVIAQSEETFGRINGVIHTAGIIDYNGVIQRRTREMTEQSMAAKVKGTVVLDTLFKDKRLDFMMLFSSIGNVVYGGKFGQVGYNAANEFLDAYAFYKRRRTGPYVLTVNWSDWTDVGMAVEATHRFYKNDPGKIQAELEALKERALTPEEGVDVFSILLGHRLSRIVVSVRDLNEELKRMNRQLQDVEANILEKVKEEPVKSETYFSKPELSTTFIAPRSDLEKKIVRIWQDFFGYREIGIIDDFFKLGGNSLSAIKVIAKINQQLNAAIPLAEFFNCPTVEGISEYIGINKAEPGAAARRSIPETEKKEYYPLFSGQRRLFILQQIEKESARYHDTRFLLLEGPLDKGKLERAVKKLVQRHDILRTSVDIIGEDPVQVVHPEAPFEIVYDEADEEKAKDLISDFIKPFALNKAPLFRMGLIKVEEEKYILVIDIHHIITDGISNALFVKELMTLYREGDLLPLPIQYRDFAQWKENRAQQEIIKQQEAYWLEQFAGHLPLINLPIDFPRPAVQSVEGHLIDFVLPPAKAKVLKKIAAEQGVTLFMVLLAAYNILLAKLSCREDIVIGTPVAGRHHPDLENVLGMFVNTLPLRNYPAGKKTFNTFLAEVKAGAVQAFRNQDYPFDQLVEQVVKDRDVSRNPVFDVMFVLEPMNMAEMEMPGLKIMPYENEKQTSKLDLTLTAVELEHALNFNFEYCTKLFKKETIQRFIGYFETIIDGIVQAAHQPLAGIDILSEREKRFLLENFNDTAADYPGDKTIHVLFEEQVRRTPDGTAVHEAYRTYMTYDQLNRTANRLAGVLRDKGVRPDTLVGILADPSMEMIAGILGIFKAGGAYLPMDTDYPPARLNHIFADSHLELLLTNTRFMETGLWNPGSCRAIDLEDSDIYQGNEENPENGSRAGDLAYVIYTSGSTGKPKGVMIQHRGVVNYISWAAGTYVRNKQLDFPLYTSISFDLTVTSLFIPLLTGNGIVVYGSDRQELLIEKVIHDNKVGVLKATPSHLKLISGKGFDNRSIHCFIVGGENFETALARDIHRDFAGNVEIYNEYGPTETVVGSMIYKFDPGNCDTPSVPIGVPIANTQIYILDHFLNPVPVGVPGELFISGHGVARGYLNNPELTNSKFQIPNNKQIPNSHLRFSLYRTGDLARHVSGGNIEFLGRVDHLVKIRGFRIELGEIEYRLLKYAKIKDAVVVVKQNADGEDHLCTYIVSGDKLPLNELKEYLLEYLPAYMVPDHFFLLDKIPLTPNGKVDNRALESEGARLKTTVEYAAPASNLEKMIAGVWRDVLHMDKISIYDNFFDIGGNSLSLIKVNARLNRLLERDIPVVEMFNFPTVHSLVTYLNRGEAPAAISEEEMAEDVNLFEEASRMLMESE